MNAKTRRRIKRVLKPKPKNRANLTTDMFKEYIKKFMLVKNLEAKRKVNNERKLAKRSRVRPKKYSVVGNTEMGIRSPIRPKILKKIKFKKTSARSIVKKMKPSAIAKLRRTRNQSYIGHKTRAEMKGLNLPKLRMFSQNSRDFKQGMMKSRYDKYSSPSKLRDSTIAPGEIPWSLDSQKVINSLTSHQDMGLGSPEIDDTLYYKNPPSKDIRKRSTNDRRKFFKTIGKGKYSSFFENIGKDSETSSMRTNIGNSVPNKSFRFSEA
ncbi:unnamed protein product [Moneuplotes crassus]|uniref:Uncharacterized protein n=1 Tax=Euplotes crassus TaxID=5936 RepID=A0AAD1UBY1_EUPCR|nr:unnamed protein product [Moneuplotes crassus]